MEENLQNYEFQKDKITYKLKTSIVNWKYIKIKCHPMNQRYGYINHFSKEDLIKINKIFENFCNIYKIQEEFDKCILAQKVSLSHNRTNFNINFYIKNKEKREKIPLNLIYENEINKNNDEIKLNYDYNDILANVEKEIIIMKKEQANVDKKVDQILSEFGCQINKNENINNNIKNIPSDNKKSNIFNHNKKNKIYFNENKLKHFIKSNIIKTSEEFNLIKNKLLSQRKNKICKTINYKLLYQATKDSDKAQIFHQKCDNKKNSMILIETTEGKKFGGFTTQSWDGDTNKQDKNAFIFSLDKLKIYDIITNQNAISCKPNFGPIFCGYQIFIYDNFFNKGGIITGNANKNFNTEKNFELNDGNVIFKVKELEVFEIIFQ